MSWRLGFGEYALSCCLDVGGLVGKRQEGGGPGHLQMPDCEMPEMQSYAELCTGTGRISAERRIVANTHQLANTQNHCGEYPSIDSPNPT
jgi:hypothetical protein